MALDQYHHGVRVAEVNDGTSVIRTVSSAVIGIVCTGADADPEAFPLNRATLITNVSTAIGKAGTQGTLRRTLTAIESQTKPIIVAVRVEEGASADVFWSLQTPNTDAGLMNAADVTTLIQRLSNPSLTEHEVRNMDPADLVQCGGEIAGFLLTKRAKGEAA